MKTAAFFSGILLCYSTLLGQKPLVTPEVYDQWTSVGSPVISNSGAYASYTINNDPLNASTLVVKSTHFNWQRKIVGSGSLKFTGDGRRAIFANGGDSLGFLTLANDSINYVGNVISSNLEWSRYKNRSLGKWLIYQLNTTKRELIVRNLQTGQLNSFAGVTAYFLDTKERILLTETQSIKDSGYALNWIDLLNDSTVTIWKGQGAKNFTFDAEGNELAFIENGKSAGGGKGAIWYYHSGLEKAEMLLDGHGLDDVDGLELNNLIGFNKDGSKLFFMLLKSDTLQVSNANVPQVAIWSYKDPQLQSLQEMSFHNISVMSYSCVINVHDKRVIRLEHDDERMITRVGNSNDDFVLIMQKGKGDLGNEWYWNKTSTISIYLESTIDGKKRIITPSCAVPVTASYGISPDEKYVIYYDPNSRNYCSYTIATGTVRNITQGIPAKWATFHRNDEPLAAYELMGIAGWLNNDLGVLIYDQNDIFEIDPSGRHDAINLTNGYGRKHNINFRVAMAHPEPFQWRELLLLSAFDRANKNDGFFNLVIGRKTDPELLVIQPYMFEGSIESDEFNRVPPIKARDTAVYLVRRMSVEESPNYFITSNFKTFSPLSDVYPEKQYNWITSTLIPYPVQDAPASCGILYKPEDFDPKKKYPVIFYYYEKLSEGLHGYIKPELENGVINIPYYVSNGYLVFVPDIHYKIGYPGKSAYKSITSAAVYLSRMPWIDKHKMGLQGHSFGGYETDYIVTHTNLFAAACSASGWADFVRAYNDIRWLTNGSSRQYYYEMFRERMGGTLWTKKDQYIENSPIFDADKITTPLLMMNNEKDGDVLFSYGVEFFNALRRLGKKVWMLEYKGEDHVLSNRIAAMDFHIRMNQFFDHYLKRKAAPKWMVEGIPAKKKGLDQGYELEPVGVEPGPGLVMPGSKLFSTGGVH
jgi:hypothetical protein